MKKTITIMLAFLFAISFAFGQKVEKTGKTDKEEKKFGVEIHGFVRYEAFFDTRKVLESRDGDIRFWPLQPVYDAKGKDIYDRTYLNMLGIQTRLNAKITGPDALGAKTSAFIEGDFIGRSQSDISQLRLRHAFIKLNWEKFELLLGETWHPMFVPECFPGVLAMGAGTPFHALNRSAQIRGTVKLGRSVKVIGALLGHRDFASVGPAGENVLRNSGLPDAQLQVKIGCPKSLFLGATVGYKTITPRLITDKGFKTEKSISSFNASAFLRITTKPVSFKLEAITGQNLTHLKMLGGYAKRAYAFDIDDYEYTNLNATSIWADIHTNNPKFEIGVFGGYTYMNGADDEVDNSVVYARGGNIDNLLRIAPRIVLKSGKLHVGVEASFDEAAYATKFDAERTPKASKSYDSQRYLLSVKYAF
ncbi:MAG: hypothetical protein CSA05_01425 [Bacteroidia bacterium]|nr:MAG: hypothetical protein CSA05_01425 [Bacteroidia bacterium]